MELRGKRPRAEALTQRGNIDRINGIYRMKQAGASSDDIVVEAL